MLPRATNRLILDLEVSPNVGIFWQTGHDIDVSESAILEERQIICAAYKWHGKPGPAKVIHWGRKRDDSTILRQLRPLLDRADEVVAHNGTRFDLPWIRGRALFHKMRPMPDVKCVDTLLIARSKFRLNSYRLDYLAQYLGVGAKTNHGGLDTWKAVMRGESDALKTMCDYCINDVEVTERVYDRIANCTRPHTHAGVMGGKAAWACPHCGSTNVRKSKTRVTPTGALQHQMLCVRCGGYYTLSNSTFKKYSHAKTS